MADYVVSLISFRSKPLVIKNDHYYKGIKDHDVIIILYAQLGTEAFNEWHNKLAALVDQGSVAYILRHYVKVFENIRRTFNKIFVLIVYEMLQFAFKILNIRIIRMSEVYICRRLDLASYLVLWFNMV